MNDKTPFNDGEAGFARGADAGSGRRFHQEKGRVGAPVNEFCAIAPDVKLGKGVRLSKFINLYGCEIGDETKIGAFVESRKMPKWGGAAKFQVTHSSAKAWRLRTTFSSATA